MHKIPSSEITPEPTYRSRRRFLAMLGLAAGSLALDACAGSSPAASNPGPTAQGAAAGKADELGDAATPLATVSNYNNYYEFSTDKEAVADLAKGFKTEPWNVTVGGLVRNPKTYSIDDLRKAFDQEERIYRLRCVEAWSMVIPWMGFSLAKLLAAAEPKAEAKYVRFETLLDPKQFPGQDGAWYQWPYVEGLRIDEAMHSLTLMGTGLYGKPLPPQNGAPLRLVVPWKYGFKSIKAIVKIDLVAEQPTSLWMNASPGEYGFYANVNPSVPHPRWSQASERRIGELTRRPTLPFNGYADQVAALYKGLDLVQNF